MVSADQFLAFSVASFILIVIPGPSAWSLAASAVRSWFARSPRRLELIGGAGGLAMISLGVTLAATGRKE